MTFLALLDFIEPCKFGLSWCITKIPVENIKKRTKQLIISDVQCTILSVHFAANNEIF